MEEWHCLWTQESPPLGASCRCARVSTGLGDRQKLGLRVDAALWLLSGLQYPEVLMATTWGNASIRTPASPYPPPPACCRPVIPQPVWGHAELWPSHVGALQMAVRGVTASRGSGGGGARCPGQDMLPR